MKELTYLQIEKIKNGLIKTKNDLIEIFKKIKRNKKAYRDYSEYEENKFYGLKDIRNLFNKKNGVNYEGIEYLFIEIDYEYEEIKEYANNIHEIIKQKEVNYEYKHIEEVNYVKTKQNLINNKEKKIHCECTLVEEKNIECRKVPEIMIDED